MAVKFTNNAKTTLASGINSTATSATVADGSVFPTLEAGEYFYCTFDDDTNNEIVKVTARSGNTLTIVRGVDNTTARAFLSGDAAELRATSALLTDIQANIAAKSANQTVYNATTASSATAYDIGIDPGVEGNAMVFLNGLMQHHDTFSFSGSTLTLDTAPADGMALEVIVDNLINLQSSNLTVDTFTAADVGGNPQVTFTLSDAPAAETNLIVFVDGVFQANDTYTISNLTLSMTDGVTAGLTVTVYVMNPVNIGAPSDGTVTTSKLSGNITMPGTLTVGAFDVAFDSPTFFVDHTNSRVGLGTATPSVPVDIVGEVKISSHLNMPDNAIAKFGTGADLQIYHSGSHSYITEAGVGNLYLAAGNLYLRKTTGENLIYTTDAGAVITHYNNAAKLATTSTGIDVTGAVTADGLTVDGTASTTGVLTLGNAGVANAFINSADSLYINIDSNNDQAGGNDFQIGRNSTAVASEKIFLAGENGDISFYEDTGTTAKFFWDASAESLGIGTTSPAYKLDLTGAMRINSSRSTFVDASEDSSAAAHIFVSNDGVGDFSQEAGHLVIQARTHTSVYRDIIFAGGINNASDLMRITGEGNVGIGTASPSAKLSVVGGHVSVGDSTGVNGTEFLLEGYREIYNGAKYGNTSIRTTYNTGSNASDMLFYTASGGTNTDERMRIASGGNVGIGTISPATKLHVTGTVGAFHSNNDNRILMYNNGTVGSINVTYGTTGPYLPLTFLTGDAERMRIDISGNVLVGASGGQLHIMNGTTIAGNIGRLNSEIFLANGDTGLRFIGSLDCIVPSDGSGANRDNAIDWGYSSVRFDDIYATNGTIQTSDRNEKQDIEELSDAETRVAVAAKGLLRKFRWKDSVVDKGDEARIHFGIIAQDLQAAFDSRRLRCR
jgi:hypothetical protein